MNLTGIRAWAVLIALILSLCLNSFFVGAIITRKAAGGGTNGNAGELRPGREMVALGGFQRLLQGLPDATRTYLRDAFDAHAGMIMPAFRDLRDARRDVLDVIAGADFSAEALASAFERVRQRTATLQQTLHRIFIDTVAGMPAEMRDEMVTIWRSRS